MTNASTVFISRTPESLLILFRGDNFPQCWLYSVLGRCRHYVLTHFSSVKSSFSVKCREECMWAEPAEFQLGSFPRGSNWLRERNTNGASILHCPHAFAVFNFLFSKEKCDASSESSLSSSYCQTRLRLEKHTQTWKMHLQSSQTWQMHPQFSSLSWNASPAHPPLSSIHFHVSEAQLECSSNPFVDIKSPFISESVKPNWNASLTYLPSSATRFSVSEVKSVLPSHLGRNIHSSCKEKHNSFYFRHCGHNYSQFSWVSKWGTGTCYRSSNNSLQSVRKTGKQPRFSSISFWLVQALSNQIIALHTVTRWGV